MDVEERLSLDAVSAHTLVAIEHRHRYALASRACAGKRVLDLCCGVGYGSAIVAADALTVVGVDRDAAAIDTAQAAHGDVTFVTADALTYLRGLEPGAFDVILCFEGLEHLDDVERIADELTRLVTGGAGMIVSVPNSATFEEENEFHVTDFDLDSARALFSGLDDAAVAYQTHAEGSLITGRAAGSVHVEVAGDSEHDLDWANHFLIFAGVDADTLLSTANAALQVAVAPLSNRYMRGLEQANRALRAANIRLSRDRLGLGAAGAGSAVLRREEEAESRLEEVRQCRHHIGTLQSELERARAEAEEARAERDEFRRAWVAVRSSRLTNLAARLAGHRFPRR